MMEIKNEWSSELVNEWVFVSTKDEKMNEWKYEGAH